MTDLSIRYPALHRRLFVLGVLLAACVSWPGLSWAGLVFSSDTDERRVKISLSIFPRVIIVDDHFRDKVTDNNVINLAFVYDKDRARAQDLRKLFLKKSQTVAGMTLKVKPVAADNVTDLEEPSFTALFVTERIGDEQFGKLVEYATRRHLVLFSPFSGDVERGATAGISVTSRVKPYFNIGTLERSQIEINSLLMNMSKRYE